MSDQNVLVKYDNRPLIVIRCKWTVANDLPKLLDWYAEQYGFERGQLDAINLETVYHPSTLWIG